MQKKKSTLFPFYSERLILKTVESSVDYIQVVRDGTAQGSLTLARKELEELKLRESQGAHLETHTGPQAWGPGG